MGLEELLGPACKERDLLVAMVVAQVVPPSSKLVCARGLRPETATSSLGEVLSVTSTDEDDLYGAMDWLLPRQGAIEDALATRNLSDGVLVVYDVSSAAFEASPARSAPSATPVTACTAGPRSSTGCSTETSPV